MSDACVPLDELAGVAELPPTDPRRVHVESCPRCAARLAAFTDFMVADDVPAGARPDAADAELERRLEARPRAGGPAGVRATVGQARRRAPLDGFEVWQRWPAAGPALAAAAVVVVVAGLWVSKRAPVEPVLRGPSADSLATGAFTIEPARVADGGVALSWSAVPGANAFEVVLYDTGMVEVLRPPAGAGTRRAVTRADLPRAIAPGTVLWWRVIALRDGAEVARSPLGTFPAP